MTFGIYPRVRVDMFGPTERVIYGFRGEVMGKL